MCPGESANQPKEKSMLGSQSLANDIMPNYE